jgi:putative multiple sugar transport system ATP-binding protein
VVISSEMLELLGICDRICVMNDGAFVGEFSGAEATQEKIMRAIMRNVRNNNAVTNGTRENEMLTGGIEA